MHNIPPVSVLTVLLGMLVILPIFERKGLFEGGANVTQKVSQTVTNWRWLCRSRIEHILCRADKENEHGWFQKQNIRTNAHHFFFSIAHIVFLPIEKETFRTGCDVTLSPLHCHHSNVQKVSLQFPVSRWGIPAAKRYVL